MGLGLNFFGHKSTIDISEIPKFSVYSLFNISNYLFLFTWNIFNRIFIISVEKRSIGMSLEHQQVGWCDVNAEKGWLKSFSLWSPSHPREEKKKKLFKIHFDGFVI